MAATVPASGARVGTAAEPLTAWPQRALALGGYALTGTDAAGMGRRTVTLPVSMLLHTAGALALVLVPLLTSDVLPEAQSGVRAFLVEPLSVPPPPPPPAARPAVAPRAAPQRQPQAEAFVAPLEVPAEITPEQALDLGADDTGSPDGVLGGVPGGVVGGIVGGLPEAPPPPVAPVRVGGSVREPRRIAGGPPVYPELAQRARLQGTVVVEATINERGRVVGVSLLEGAPILTEAALEAVKKWVYTPTLLNGVPTPIIMTVRVYFRLGAPTA